MDSKLLQELKKVLPSQMYVPDELKMLYQWIEEQKLCIETKQGASIGLLYPEKKLKDSWTDDEREGGTLIYFQAEGAKNLKYWFGKENEEINQRLCVFAQSGAEGSMCALWLNEEGKVKIVHMGSGSGSTLICVLAENAIDFLRLVAIGYDEICWHEEYALPPNATNSELFVKPNLAFQKWVNSTFNVEIPKTALEIVKHPTSMGADDSEDDFYNWCAKYIN